MGGQLLGIVTARRLDFSHSEQNRTAFASDTQVHKSCAALERPDHMRRSTGPASAFRHLGQALDGHGWPFMAAHFDLQGDHGAI